MISKATTYKEIIKSLPYEYRNGENMNIILKVIHDRYTKLCDDLNKIHNIEVKTATGDLLDKLGRLFGCNREGQNDDEYREDIRLKQLTIGTSGTKKEMKTIMSKFFKIGYEDFHIKDIDANKYDIFDREEAGMIIEMPPVIDMDKMVKLIKLIKPIGVTYVFETVAIVKTKTATLEWSIEGSYNNEKDSTLNNQDVLFDFDFLEDRKGLMINRCMETID